MLLLDSEALSALAHGPVARQTIALGLVAKMRQRQQSVVTVAAVLAEVVRGRAADARVFHTLRQYSVAVLDVDRAIAVRAGKLLGAIRRGSELAVDAFIVAAADLAGGGIIATVDVDDLWRLAAHAQPGVRVVSIQP